tara:strand:+ start:139 stop:609 length:471 start_codon:yes stop_codon:yes gene_type:complete
MRQITHTYTVYRIGEHPDKERCINWVRDNVHDLNQHDVDEMIASLKALQARVGGSLDYCVGQFPDRGEYIRFTDYDKDAFTEVWSEAVDSSSEILTGTLWDWIVISHVDQNDMKGLLGIIHRESEYAYSDESIETIAGANEWEFKEDGSLYHEVRA